MGIGNGGEGQNVGWAVDAPMLQVQRPDLFVVHDAHAEADVPNALCLKAGVRYAPQQRLQPLHAFRHGYVPLQFDGHGVCLLRLMWSDKY